MFYCCDDNAGCAGITFLKGDGVYSGIVAARNEIFLQGEKWAKDNNDASGVDKGRDLV